MLADSENYKGIKFVRISSLPQEQKAQIWNSFNINLIIKILKGETLLNDCLEYKHYVSWYEKIYAPQNNVAEVITDSLKIAS
jgi:hypothetical protein